MATSAPITAEGLDVVIIGGGDTGTDCFGTALRQRAQSVVHVDIRARPPGRRSPQMPWPTYPAIYRTAPAHEEGGLRRFSLATLAFVGDGQHRLHAIQVVDGFRDEARTFHPRSEVVEQLPAQLALVALGFAGAEPSRLLADLDIKISDRGTLARDENFMSNVDGVFVAGDAGRGPSLIVWAIAEGRSAAASVDTHLTDREILPQPIHPKVIERAGRQAPPAEPDHAAETPVDLDTRTMDLSELGAVVWCTGFGGDFSWLDPALVDAAGQPTHSGCAAAMRGVWYIGLRWLTHRGSATLDGFPTDAATVADAVRAQLNGSDRTLPTTRGSQTAEAG